MLRLEFRNSVARLPSVAFVAIGSLLVGSEQVATSSWLGRGYDTELYLTVIVATLNGIAAGVGGARLGLDLWRRRGTMPQLSTRGSLGTVWPSVAAGYLWLSIGTAVVSAFALGRTAFVNTSMELSPLLVLLVLLVPGVWFAVGFAVSSAWSSRGAVVFMAALPYLLTMAVGQWGSATVLQLAPFIDQRWDPGFVPAPVVLGAFVGRWAIWMAVAAAATWALAPVAGRLPRRARIGLLSGSVAAAVALALVSAGPVVGEDIATPRPAQELTCSRPRDGASACLWPTQASQEPEWSRALDAFNADRRNLPQVAVGFAVMPPIARPELVGIDASVSLLPAARLADAMDQAYVEMLVRHCDVESSRWLVTFLHWVAIGSPHRSSRPDLRSRWVDAYLRQPVADRGAWLDELVTSCGAE